VGCGLVIIDNDVLTDLDGLASLTAIDEGSYIIANQALSNLDGLDGLTAIDNSLYLVNNPALTSIQGLSNITSVSSHLEIIENESLTDLAGLDSLTAIGGDLVLRHGQFADLSALHQLESVGGELRIKDNALTSLNGLENLASVGGLTVTGNDLLSSLEGLGNLEAIHSDGLLIDNNIALVLLGLRSLTAISDSFRISNNIELCTFLAEDLRDQADFGDTAQIYGNKDCSELGPPLLTTPPPFAELDNNCHDLVDTVDWTFVWEAVPGATAYQIQIFDARTPDPLIDAIVETPAFGLLRPDWFIEDRDRLKWHWQVRAGRPEIEYWSDNWSERRYFDVEPLNTDCQPQPE
jgi:hypothetical protein